MSFAASLAKSTGLELGTSHPSMWLASEQVFNAFFPEWMEDFMPAGQRITEQGSAEEGNRAAAALFLLWPLGYLLDGAYTHLEGILALKEKKADETPIWDSSKRALTCRLHAQRCLVSTLFHVLCMQNGEERADDPCADLVFSWCSYRGYCQALKEASGNPAPASSIQALGNFLDLLTLQAVSPSCKCHLLPYSCPCTTSASFWGSISRGLPVAPKLTFSPGFA